MNTRNVRTVSLVAVFLGVLPLCGCVTAGTYNAKVAELDKARGDADTLSKQLSDMTKERDDLRAKYTDAVAKITDLEHRLADTQAQLTNVTGERDRLSKSLDDTTALAGQLKERLEKLGQNVDRLTAEKGQLATGLQDAKARLEELRKQKAAAEARAATFRDLVARLRAMIDSGQLKVVIRDGRMLIALPDDVLFDSGKTDIKPQGQEALAKVAQVLATLPDRHFLVAGNTDTVEVTQLLIAKGMKPQVLAAAGFSEFDPVAQNDTPEHRAQNRRIEIVLQPNLSDLPSLEGIDSGQGTKSK